MQDVVDVLHTGAGHFNTTLSTILCVSTKPVGLCNYSQAMSTVQVDLYKTWLTCSTLVLAFSFSFSNTLKNLLEAIIYLFVVHPFDVGDGILVGTTGTDYFKVGSCSHLQNNNNNTH